MSLNIIFMGTPKFSLPALDKLIKNKFNILAVYTQSPKKSQRGQKINISPVEEFSRKKKLNIRNSDVLNSKEEFEIFKNFSPDIVIVVAYGKIIPKNFLKIPKLGFINIHASLLPKWRGAAPIQRAIMSGDKNIGVSIMKIEEKLDSGPILSSKKIYLDKNLTFGEIELELSLLGANLLITDLKSIENGHAEFKRQIEKDATYAKKINKNETKINWNLNADKVISHIHGLSPNPGAWFEYNNNRFKVLRAQESLLSGKSGSVINDNLTVACKYNSVQILEIQKEGKKKQTIKEFLLGNKINNGSILI